MMPLVSNDGLSSMTLSSVLALHSLVLSLTVQVLAIIHRRDFSCSPVSFGGFSSSETESLIFI